MIEYVLGNKPHTVVWSIPDERGGSAPSVREHIVTLIEEDGVEPGETIFDANILAVDYDPVTNVGDVVNIRAEDGVVTMRMGSMLSESFTPEVALQIGEAYIRAALSQMTKA